MSEVYIRGIVVASSDRGVLVSIKDIGASSAPPNTEEWLPKSQISTDTDLENLSRGEIIDFNLPGWLALERGLFDD